MYFNNIIGHDPQKKFFIRAFEDRRVSHAYLFFGVEGVGKKLMALGFAKLLNCLSYESERDSESGIESCDCNSCKKINKGIHPDVFVVEYKGIKDIKVEQIREEIEDRLYFAAFEGRFKVAIVDNAERMNISAQNAFLKNLEEPPADSVIILVTSRPQSLLSTVHSRCQSVPFRGLPEDTILREIRGRTGLSLEEATVVARLSGGSFGKALGLDKQFYKERKVLITRLSKVNSNYASSVYGVLDLMPLSSREDDSDRLKIYFEVILHWIRDLALLKTGLDQQSLTHRDLLSLSREYSYRLTLGEILEKLKYVEYVMSSIFQGNANRQIALENLVLKIAE